jgi:hypothetical protein
MRSWRQFVIAIALMLALPLPAAVSCFAAEAQGSGADPACCKAMRMACGAENNPVSQGCCVKTTAVHRPEATAPKSHELNLTSADAGVLIPQTAGIGAGRDLRFVQQSQVHPPGHASPGITPLRL